MTSTLVVFEGMKKRAEDHTEYWSARELAKVLEYLNFRNFIPVIEKAKKSCKNTGQSIKYHFADYRNMIELGKSASRETDDIRLSRYACYLIMQNADPSKKIVALGQSYFAIQTRKQELGEQLAQDQERVHLRGDLTARNKHLAAVAIVAGVHNFGMFTNSGYKGLYGGLDAPAIHKRKKLKKNQQILDYMDGEELGANIFRATQADARIRREHIQGEAVANQVHFEVGKEVRKTIKKMGGTMPEDLPVVENIGRVKRRLAAKKKPVALTAKA